MHTLITFRIWKVEFHNPSFANVHTRNCELLVSIYGFLKITLRIELELQPLVLLLTTITQSNNILIVNYKKTTHQIGKVFL